MRSLFFAVCLIAVSVVSSLALRTPPASALEVSQPPRMVTVNGLSERKVVPDEAHIQVNVNALAAKVETAKAEHDRKLKEVIAIAKKEGVDDAQIKTQHSSIQPQYTYENNKRVFKGYQVQTMLDVTVKKTESLGALVEKLSAAKLENTGANEWQNLVSVSYSLSNPDKIRDEMLADAIKNARMKAERMADAAGAKVGRVMAINEGGAPSFAFPPMPMARGGVMMAMKAESTDAMTPPPGEQQVNATVTVSFELKD